jgi:hypothetical protein
MDFIYQHASLPTGTKVTAENFLRLNADKTNETHTATINAFGFRGLERTIEKPEKLFKITSAECLFKRFLKSAIPIGLLAGNNL